MTLFIKGLDLCERFFNEVAQPILAFHFPNLHYSAAVIGFGSDTLGLDDEISTDHMWGPRLQLFLPEEDFNSAQGIITAVFTDHLPYEYRGYSVHFGQPDPNDNHVRIPVKINQGEVNPLIEYFTIASYGKEYLGYNPSDEVTITQWLTFSEHRLLGVTSGRVFHDDLGLVSLRQKLAYYPRDIWLWMMASQWKMIAEEEVFVGRCGYVGDELGSRLIAARQIQRIMRLCFLMEKRYAPYSKWFGTAFQQLAISPQISPILSKVATVSNWEDREQFLCNAYSLLVNQHNSLLITDEINPECKPFFNRPFRVLFADRLVEALINTIQEPVLKQTIPAIGTPSQFTDSTTVFDDITLMTKLRHLYT